MLLAACHLAALEGASDPRTALAVRPNLIQFRQELNNYVWQLSLGRSYLLGRRWQWSFNEQFRTSMLRAHLGEEKWKDDHTFISALHFRLLPVLEISAHLHSLFFFDRQTGLNNDVRSHSLGGGVAFRPVKELRVALRSGPRWESKLGFHDQGHYLSGTMQLDALRWGGYAQRAQASLDADQYQQRRNHQANLQYTVSRAFAAGTSDSLRIYDLERRFDNYTSALGDIESLREGSKGVENTLNYGLSPQMHMVLRNGWQFRNVELHSFGAGTEKRQRKRNDVLGDHVLETILNKPGARGRLSLSYLSLTQKYDMDKGSPGLPFSRFTSFIAPDNSSRRLQLLGEWMQTLGRRDSLYAYASVSRFQYDTPDTNNFDDRDELRLNSSFTFRHRLRDGWWLDIQSSLSLYHMVYIFGERSADNNWNRILRLRPVLTFRPSPDFHWHQSFEVLANYVDYDFENISPQTRSFVFRKFAYEDSLRLALTRKSALRVDYRLQLEENGQLYWEAWRERVLTTRQSHWFQCSISHKTFSSLYVSPGYGVYLRDEWRHERDPMGNERKIKSQTYISHGPALEVMFSVSPRSRFVMDAVRRVVKPSQQNKYFITTLDVRLDWIF